MRIERGNPYYNVGQNSARPPAGATPAAAAKPQPTPEAPESFKNEQQSQYEQLNQQLKWSEEQIKGEMDKLKIMLICMEIARRISGGDEVPPEDHQFLMENDLALYTKSILQRFPKSNPHKYKRLSKDEDCQEAPKADALKLSFTNAFESCRGLSDTLTQGISAALSGVYPPPAS